MDGAGTIGSVGRGATRIRVLRVQRHLAQAALAKEARLSLNPHSRTYLSRLEAGIDDPKLSMLKRIAKDPGARVARLGQ
jgi:transcriptional regulator with XRE-family HTH domain